MPAVSDQLRNAWDYYCEFGLRGAYDVIRQRGRSGPVEIRAKGVRHPVSYRVGTSDFSMLRGVIGKRSLQLRLNRDPSLIVDGGANVGYASISFANRFPAAKIIAIEPDASNFRLLSANTAVYPNVQPIQAAVWWRETTLNIMNPTAANASFQMGEQVAEQGGVPAVTIKSLVTQHGPIDILKLDIEGAEKDVFENHASEWLNDVGVIVVETHDRLVSGTTAAIREAVRNVVKRETTMGEYHVFDLKGVLA